MTQNSGPAFRLLSKLLFGSFACFVICLLAALPRLSVVFAVITAMAMGALLYEDAKEAGQKSKAINSTNSD